MPPHSVCLLTLPVAPRSPHSFPTRRSSDLHLERLEQARLRDHRRLGRELDLFLFSELSPGEQEEVELPAEPARSEEHTSELQSRRDIVCRLLLEKKKKKKTRNNYDTTSIMI